MSSRNHANVSLRFLDGSVISAWESFSLRENYLDPLGEYTLTARPPRAKIDDYREKLQKGNLVSLLINEVPQGVCLIQTSTQTIGREGVDFKITAHTPLVTAVQGSANPDYTFHSE